jgi:D-alanine-D-alanine ligase
VLEANAVPGLTETSLLPQAAEAAGISFDELVQRILAMALQDAQAR